MPTIPALPAISIPERSRQMADQVGRYPRHNSALSGEFVGGEPVPDQHLGDPHERRVVYFRSKSATYQARKDISASSTGQDRA